MANDGTRNDGAKNDGASNDGAKGSGGNQAGAMTGAVAGAMAEVLAAVQAGDAARLESALKADPAAAGARDAGGVSATMLALYRGRKDLAAKLAEMPGQLDIFEAASLGRVWRIRDILKTEPDAVNRWSGDGFTALHFASFFGQEEAALALLEHGANPCAVARNGMKVMPLHSAATARSLPIVRALLENGADANAPQEKGWRAIHSAAQNGDSAMVEELLKYGADPRAASDDGTTAAQLAAAKGHAELAERLKT